jgi:transmembrane sensor
MSAAQDIEMRASEWLMRAEEPDWSEAQQAELDAWLAESDAHKAAYWRLEHGWRSADRLGALRNHRVEVELAQRRPTRWLWPIAASIALTLGLGSYGWQQWQAPKPEPEIIQIATKVGMRKLVRLDDGSQIDLNTGSAIRTAVNETSRVVWLDRGEAYFSIAKRKGQFFIVHAGAKTITVLGTKFSVRRDGDKVSVVVEEGRVRVEDGNQAGLVRSTIIEGGDVAVVRGTSTLVTTAGADRVDDALAWRGGMLSFDQRSLSEVAAEFNRYNRKKLIIGDTEAGAIRIGGSFKADNVDAFVRLLRDAYGLKIDDSEEAVTISS